ncbi:Peptide chain release factor 2 [Pseudobythopirellula maris]|uniref:Peptide chain release factor 2 n=1 Tax=Pseudobythopirellula maris TaxID=2527991 RepID=A0A5C5ZRG5_9BACT|nr:peptide chain release factor-like protein [Pseudobythopirellula maris]TWT90094.1 Peptide chain release factor 2 [Pseudobythopirellula maris]
MHPAKLPIDELLKQCDARRLRRSGPGGQHRNKVETAVVLTHTPTGVVAEANERRSQHANHEVAVGRLRVNLALETRDEAPADPSPLWTGRTRGGKISVNPGHADFPALLAEALDTLAATEWDDAAAAERLGVSRTQLLKLLKLEPRAFALLNTHRNAAGLPPLK